METHGLDPRHYSAEDFSQQKSCWLNTDIVCGVIHNPIDVADDDGDDEERVSSDDNYDDEERVSTANVHADGRAGDRM